MLNDIWYIHSHVHIEIKIRCIFGDKQCSGRIYLITICALQGNGDVINATDAMPHRLTHWINVKLVLANVACLVAVLSKHWQQAFRSYKKDHGLDSEREKKTLALGLKWLWLKLSQFDMLAEDAANLYLVMSRIKCIDLKLLRTEASQNNVCNWTRH